MWLWQHLRAKFLFCVWLGTVGLPMLGFHWVEQHHPQYVPAPIKWLLLPIFLLYIGGGFYITISTIHHLDNDITLSVWDAVKRSYATLRQWLPLIPIIGPFFQPDEDKTHYDPDDD